MLKKLGVTSLLCGSLLLSNVPFTSAESESISILKRDFNETVVEYNDQVINLNFDNSEVYNKITDNIIKDILNESNGNGDITIHEIGDEDGNNLTPYVLNQDFSNSVGINELAPYSLLHDYQLTKKKDTIYNTPMPAIQVESVAYGETVVLSESRTYTNSFSLSGEYDSGAGAKLGAAMNTSVSYTYAKSRTLDGPPKGYITKIYYHTKYVDYGDWEVTKINKISGHTVYQSGSYREPTDATTKYINWSQIYK
ncbi:hypothetical protein [Metasolibacillus meyeri]|uniref:hypothetical protein n=1 Tax=Metasolibacillus meyeri TaxID=1071052 RepID=UPI000D30B824|nr:hypothetical protein [Metasolibacillus meyeri]